MTGDGGAVSLAELTGAVRAASPAPPIIVVMGVSGVGKTTVGARLAADLGVPFLEGDDLHPPANIAKMARGEPLGDADRGPWLARVGAAMAEARHTGVVVACSALKRRYRDALRARVHATLFVHLTVPEDLLRARLAARTGHFMPAVLLDSQLRDLQPPDGDEHRITVDGTGPVRNAGD